MPAEQFELIEKRLDTIASDVAVLKTDVAVLKTDVAVLKTDVAVLKTDVGGIKTDVASLHRSAIRHESMHDELRQLAESVVLLGQRMDRGFEEVRNEMREIMAPLMHTVTGHSARLLDHEGRISAIETRPA